MIEYVEGQIDKMAERILTSGQKLDDHAFGSLRFLVALRRVLSGNATAQDLGLMARPLTLFVRV